MTGNYLVVRLRAEVCT